MSKKNKNKNKNKNSHNHNQDHKLPISNTVQESASEAESNAISLDDHLEQMELQSMSDSNTDSTIATIAKAADVAPEEVKEEVMKVVEKRAEPMVAEVEEKGAVNWVVFGVGLVIGAIITSLFL